MCDSRIESYSKIQTISVPLTQAEVRGSESVSKLLNLRFTPRFVSAKILTPSGDTNSVFQVRCNFIKDESLTTYPQYDPVHSDSSYRETVEYMRTGEYTFSFWTQIGNAWTNGMAGGFISVLVLTFIA